MQPGDKVRIKAHPGCIGILGNETDGPPSRLRYLVSFLDGTEDFFPLGALEKVEAKPKGLYELMRDGRCARVSDLRGAITFFRLCGKLVNLISSLNTTNTTFLSCQFKPVLQFLDSPSNGLLIADEDRPGKMGEAGLMRTVPAYRNGQPDVELVAQLQMVPQIDYQSRSSFRDRYVSRGQV